LRTDPPEIPEVHDDDIMTTVTVMDDEGMQRSRGQEILHLSII
jgi:hypothetical protein